MSQALFDSALFRVAVPPNPPRELADIFRELLGNLWSSTTLGHRTMVSGGNRGKPQQTVEKPCKRLSSNHARNQLPTW